MEKDYIYFKSKTIKNDKIKTHNLFNSKNQRIFEEILGFLNIKELLNLSQVNKCVNNMIRKSQIWSKFILDQHIWSDNIYLFCSAEEDEYKELYDQKTGGNLEWNCHFKKIVEIKKMNERWVNNININISINIQRDIFACQRDPEIAEPKQYKKCKEDRATTEFQEFLSNIIFEAYDDTTAKNLKNYQNFSKFEEDQDDFGDTDFDDDFLNNSMDMSFDDCKEQKSFKEINKWVKSNEANIVDMITNINTREFIALRWYYYICEGLEPSVYLFDEDQEKNFEKKHNKFSDILYELEDLTISGFTDENAFTDKTESNCENNVNQLNDLLVIITLSIRSWCQILKSLINSQKDPYSKILIYNTNWKCFNQSIQQVSSEQKDLEVFINQNFGEIFVDIPRNPDFRFWRLMVKIWIYEIANPIQHELASYSMQTINKQRYCNFQTIFADVQSPSKKIYPRDCKEIAKCNLEMTEIKNFIEFITDISLNEVTIHWSNHTDVTASVPYQKVEKLFQEDCQNIYNDNFDLMAQNSGLLKDFIESEAMIISKFLQNKTYNEFHWKVYKFIKGKIEHKVSKYSNSSTCNTSILKDQKFECGYNMYESIVKFTKLSSLYENKETVLENNHNFEKISSYQDIEYEDQDYRMISEFYTQDFETKEVEEIDQQLDTEIQAQILENVNQDVTGSEIFTKQNKCEPFLMKQKSVEKNKVEIDDFLADEKNSFTVIDETFQITATNLLKEYSYELKPLLETYKYIDKYIDNVKERFKKNNMKIKVKNDNRNIPFDLGIAATQFDLYDMQSQFKLEEFKAPEQEIQEEKSMIIEEISYSNSSEGEDTRIQVPVDDDNFMLTGIEQISTKGMEGNLRQTKYSYG